MLFETVYQTTILVAATTKAASRSNEEALSKFLSTGSCDRGVAIDRLLRYRQVIAIALLFTGYWNSGKFYPQVIGIEEISIDRLLR